jgi:hypothetical protein
MYESIAAPEVLRESLVRSVLALQMLDKPKSDFQRAYEREATLCERDRAKLRDMDRANLMYFLTGAL